ncbi:MAG: DUF4339 domain-containing protein [Planctomycetes bacterium]|nr:DUF4339 domain-containing protein [Planctomycetota bacterium]
MCEQFVNYVKGDPSMAAEWYYVKKGKKLGPIGFTDLKKLASARTLLPSDLVWVKGMSDWVAAETIDGLSFLEVPNEKAAGKENQSLVDDQALVDETKENEDSSLKKDDVLGLLVLAVIVLSIVIGWGKIWSFITWLAILGTATTTAWFSVEAYQASELAKRRNQAIKAGVFGAAFIVLFIVKVVSWQKPPGLQTADLELATVVVKVTFIGKESPLGLPPQERVQYQPGPTGVFGSAFVFENANGVLRLYTNSHVTLLDTIASIANNQSVRRADIGMYKIEIVFPSKSGAGGKTRSVSRFAICSDLTRDVAILEVSAQGLVEGEDYVVVPRIDDCFDTLSLRSGDEVIAVGAPANPFGSPDKPMIAGTQSFGRVNNIGTLSNDDVTWITHDAEIWHGNSGGPLFLKRDDRVYWIGINTLMDPKFSFALSADDAVNAQYEWAKADPQGAANLISRVYGVPAVIAEGIDDNQVAQVDGRRAPLFGVSTNKQFKPISFPKLNIWSAIWTWKNLGILCLLLICHFAQSSSEKKAVK